MKKKSTKISVNDSLMLLYLDAYENRTYLLNSEITSIVSLVKKRRPNILHRWTADIPTAENPDGWEDFIKFIEKNWYL